MTHRDDINKTKEYEMRPTKKLKLRRGTDFVVAKIQFLKTCGITLKAFFT